MLREIDEEIESILYPYVKVKSTTGTELERNGECFLLDYFSNIDYFKKNIDHYGAYKIKDDLLDRSVCWAMVKGTGRDTVVFLHHYDTVDTEDFKLLMPFAYSPEELELELMKIKNTLNNDAKEDLESGEFLFGRGTADMKGGGAIQLALLKRYSEIKGLVGNILLIAVPDEENLSAGMRSAVQLLDELKDNHNLNYLLMINSEPHQRVDKHKGVLSEGSVGKVMPFVYVRGYLSHIGKVFEGFNPINLLSRIVAETELNLELSDVLKNESSPPPTWLYLKDNKQQYDVSMPLSASGCFSVLTLYRTPEEILDSLNSICMKAFNKVIVEMNEKFKCYNEGMEKEWKPLPWKPIVTTFKSLYDEASDKYGSVFLEHYENKLKQIKIDLDSGKLSMLQSSFSLVEAVYDYVDDLSPRVIIGLIPPYYPNVTNIFFDNPSLKISSLSRELKEFSNKNYEQEYTTEYFYTGISDLSYTSIHNGKNIIEALENSMPLFGHFYDIPIDCIERISMPCMNIGPWGKDFHKLTERVYREDLFYRTPELINHAVSYILGWQ